VKVAKEVRHALEIRKSAKSIAPDVVNDPAWEILLGLYDAMSAGRSACLNDLSELTGLSLSLCIRWIKILQGRGYINSSPDRSLSINRTKFSLENEGVSVVEKSFSKHSIFETVSKSNL